MRSEVLPVAVVPWILPQWSLGLLLQCSLIREQQDTNTDKFIACFLTKLLS